MHSSSPDNLGFFATTTCGNVQNVSCHPARVTYPPNFVKTGWVVFAEKQKTNANENIDLLGTDEN